MQGFRRHPILVLASLYALLVACVTSGGPEANALHRWWSGLGPVMPHDTFPADCSLCHVGSDWNRLVPGFEFDHAAETGVLLEGAHSRARCLRCHNDRGPVAVFASQGCAGCHEDIHLGELGADCRSCHDELTWMPGDMLGRHLRTRFPLIGAHAVTACRQCHPGAELGRYVPAPIRCAECHQADLARALNPSHAALGWVRRCDSCHQPTTWQSAELDPNF